MRRSGPGAAGRAPRSVWRGRAPLTRGEPSPRGLLPADLTNSPESCRADDLVDECLPPDPNDFTEVVFVRSDKLAAGERRFAETVDDVRAQLGWTGYRIRMSREHPPTHR